MGGGQDHDEASHLRWQRRERRRASERLRMRKHGARIARIYRDAVLKRLRDEKRK